MQVHDVRRRIRDGGSESVEQAVRLVEPAGAQQSRHEAHVLAEEPVRVGYPDPRGDRQQLVGLGHARDPDVDRERDALRSARPDPGVDRGWVEAQLGRHVARERRLRAERLEQQAVGDERVTLRIAGDPDLVERVTDLGHLAQQRQPIRIVAWLLLVPAHNERAAHAGAFEPCHEVAQVLAVANHPRRKMRHGPEPRILELLAESDGRFEALRR